MEWAVDIKVSVIDDLDWFGPKESRRVLEELEEILAANPMAATKNMKTLRPNPFAQRELRLGKYRVLFNVDTDSRIVTVRLVGEKRGERLIVQGEEFTSHHESNPP